MPARQEGGGEWAGNGRAAGVGLVGVVWVGRFIVKPEVYNLDFRDVLESLDSAICVAVLRQSMGSGLSRGAHLFL